MTLKGLLVARARRLASSGAVGRLVSNDAVLRIADVLMDARDRIAAARKPAAEALELLLHGREPAGHPPLDAPSPSSRGAVADDPGPRSTPEADHPRPTPRAWPDHPGAVPDAATPSFEPARPAAAAGDVLEKCFRFTTADSARAIGVYPFFRPLDHHDGPEAQLDGRRVVMLGSGNYLGLTTHPKVRSAAQRAIDTHGTSMTSSRLTSGTMKLHEELEAKLAAFHGKEAGLVFTTGYQVNIAAISALVGDKKSAALIDKDDHSSIYDGVRLAQAVGARMVRFKHGDAASLNQALAALPEGEGALVITDGVFGAHGEIADLPALVEVTRKRRARLLIDDAHGLGVLGPGGRGTAAHFGLAGEVDLIGGTFSKSLASTGGWLVGDRKVLDYIQHFAPSFLFATAAAPPSVAAAMAALEVMQEEPWRQQRLAETSAYMRAELGRLGFDLGRSRTAVIPIYIRDDLKTVMMWKALLDDYGIYTNPFITPGVAPEQQALRTSYMATHERIHLDRALDALEKVGKRFGVI